MEPNKQEKDQLKSLIRQLNRLSYTTDNLYRRMAINGRGKKYCDTAKYVSAQLSSLSKQIQEVVMTNESL